MLNENAFTQIKNNLLKNLKEINFDKKDKELLLTLITLFDFLSEKKEENFNSILTKLIENCPNEKKEELGIRLNSLNLQLERYRYVEIRHLNYATFYEKRSKIDIYIQKFLLDWEPLIKEIEKHNFEWIRVYVYKTKQKKEKQYESVTSSSVNWKKDLINLLETNVCTNVHIVLDFEKEKL